MNKDYIEPETNNVVGVQFSIMSPDEIRKRSVVEVTRHETYDKDTPVIKGLFDIRMGTTEMGKVCGTCGQNNMNCPGHFGHCELARPIYHYQFISLIQKILKCTCIQCSKLLINKESATIKNLMKKSNKHRWNEIYNLSQKLLDVDKKQMMVVVRNNPTNSSLKVWMVSMLFGLNLMLTNLSKLNFFKLKKLEKYLKE